MKFWTKISLSVLGLGLVVGLYFADEHYTKKEEESKTLESKVIGFDVKDVRKLELVNVSGTFAFERSSAEAPWSMLLPKKVKPDQDTINNLLSSLNTLSVESEVTGSEKIAAENTAENAKYGLDQPRIKIVVRLANNVEKKLAIGGDVNIGSETSGKFNALSVYAVNPERKKMMIIPSSSINTFQKTFADMRSKIAWDFDKSQVQEVEIVQHKMDNIKLTKSGAEWKITAPRDSAADSNNVGLYLDKMSRLVVDNVIETEQITNNTLADLDLANPAATIQVFGEQHKLMQTFKVGITKSSVNVLMGDGAVGTLKLDKWTELVPSLKYFKDKRILRGLVMNDVIGLKTSGGRAFKKEGNDWYLTTAPGFSAAAQKAPADPKSAVNKEAGDFMAEWEFMNADDVIDDARAKNLTTYGLQKADKLFMIEFSEGSKKPVETIIIGSEYADKEKKKWVYVKKQNKPEVYSVEANWLENFKKIDTAQAPSEKKAEPANPLAPGSDPSAKK